MRYPPLSAERRAEVRSSVVRWSSPRRRPLPWHGGGDAYRVLVAEVLVRRTRASRILPVFEALVARWPSPEALADAPLAEVRRLIRSVGLPSRAEVLQAAARRAVAEHDGRIPRDPQVLATWRGIGRYTANAVACLGYDAPYPMVDEAVGRLLRRLAGVTTDASVYSDGGLWNWARDLVPEEGAREFNLALLHLSKELCRARNPRCDICPLGNLCPSASSYYRRPGARLSRLSRTANIERLSVSSGRERHLPGKQRGGDRRSRTRAALGLA